MDAKAWDTFLEDNKLKYLLDAPNYLEKLNIFRMERYKFNRHNKAEIIIAAEDRFFLFREISITEINVYELKTSREVFQFLAGEIIEDDYIFVGDFLLEFFPELLGEDDELNGLVNLFFDFVTNLKEKQFEI